MALVNPDNLGVMNPAAEPTDAESELSVAEVAKKAFQLADAMELQSREMGVGSGQYR